MPSDNQDKYLQLKDLYTAIYADVPIRHTTISTLFQVLGLPINTPDDLKVTDDLSRMVPLYEKVTGLSAEQYLTHLAYISGITGDVPAKCRTLLLSLLIEVMKPHL